MRLAPAFRKRFGDFQPDQEAAVRPLFFVISSSLFFWFCRPGKAKPPPGVDVVLRPRPAALRLHGPTKTQNQHQHQHQHQQNHSTEES
ncbi:hypothetical protein FHC51_11395 [Leclercia sp. EC_58]|uniref:hypothetical protein n=1 Tax=Leclercia sp. EC_58 TaxID=2584090 RepID=UPI001C70080E|nr:hypothetical protein [Leclercia sp. EC_58]MBW9400412.1 hypothetical protein [Leclercia sp. EC_58]